MFEKESAMNTQDHNIHETNDRRNELESYVLEMRNSVMGGDLENYVTAAEKAVFGPALDTMESWLYDEGMDAQKSEYVIRLKSLKETGDPIAKRKHEQEQRPAYASALRGCLSRLLQWTAQEENAHVPAAEREKLALDCQTADAWLAEMYASLSRALCLSLSVCLSLSLSFSL